MRLVSTCTTRIGSQVDLDRLGRQGEREPADLGAEVAAGAADQRDEVAGAEVDLRGGRALGGRDA